MDSEIYRLAEQLGDCLQKRNLKIATAESCTGGMIAKSITDVPGSSAWFDRGFVTYSNAAKVQMLGVKKQTLEKFGAVSEQVAREMAEGALKNSEADLVVAVTGIAGPDGGTEQKPIGTVFIAWITKSNECIVEKLSLLGDRSQIRGQSVTIALTRSLKINQ